MSLVRERVTFEEYLAFEEANEFRHEFLDGDIFAMDGGTPEHGAVCAAVSGALSPMKRPYRAFSGSLRIHTPSGMAAYPDASIVRGLAARDADGRNALTNPMLIIEVLSQDSEARDRGNKFTHYRSCPSFVEYVLVTSQGEPRIERFLKTNGVWTLCDDAGPGQVQRLSSIDVVLEVDAIYAGLIGADGQIRIS